MELLSELISAGRAVDTEKATERKVLSFYGFIDVTHVKQFVCDNVTGSVISSVISGFFILRQELPFVKLSIPSQKVLVKNDFPFLDA